MPKESPEGSNPPNSEEHLPAPDAATPSSTETHESNDALQRAIELYHTINGRKIETPRGQAVARIAEALVLLLHLPEHENRPVDYWHVIETLKQAIAGLDKRFQTEFREQNP